jgi:hypothetical protein
MSHRPKSNLISSEEKPAWKEPSSGPGSACCFCRIMNRREKAREARQRLVVAVSHEETRKICVPPMKARLGRPVLPAMFGRRV